MKIGQHNLGDILGYSFVLAGELAAHSPPIFMQISLET